jgi:thiosulfate reductase cytochrome b subunit
MTGIGRLIIIAGFLLIIIGLIIYFSDKLPFIGKMPGDILVKKKNFTFYFPVVTSIILSIVISLILYLINRFR